MPNGTDPTALFDMDKEVGTVPCKIQFTNRSTGSGTLTYAWDFGNGATSTVKDPSYTYTNAGFYTVSLTVTGIGGKNTATKTATISPIGNKPLATFTYTLTNGGHAPCTVTLTNNSLSATKFAWSFGDGSPLDTNKTPQPHTYTTVDKLLLNLKASNSAGDSHDTTLIVTIKPTACFVANCNACLAIIRTLAENLDGYLV